MRNLVCLACLLGLGAAVSAFAPTPTNRPPSSQDIDRLISQLGDRDFRVRQKAGQELVALGKEALPAMLKGRSHPDAEVRRRLDELIPPMERSIVLAPKRVTLHVTNKPLLEVFNELARQTGYKIVSGQTVGAVRPRAMAIMQDMAIDSAEAPAAPSSRPANPQGGKPSYTFHFDQIPFWQAFDKICEAGGMVPQYFGDDAIHVAALDSYEPYICYAGPFKVVATGFTYNRWTDMSQLSRNPYQPGRFSQEYLQLSLMISSEPKAPIVALGQVRLSEALDEEGHSMQAATTDEYGFGGGLRFRRYRYYNRGCVQYTQTSLVWAAKNCRTVKTLNGKIPVTLLAEQKPTVVTDNLLAAKGKKLKVGNTTFVIDEITGGGNRPQQLKISVTEENANPRDYSRMQSLQQRLEIQDAKGNKLPFNAAYTRFANPGNAQFNFMIQRQDPKHGPPSKLIYVAWVLMEHEIEFAFKDLPLP